MQTPPHRLVDPARPAAFPPTAATSTATVATPAPPAPAPKPFSRIPGIDGLRALAILIVMASHAGLGKVVPGGLGVTIFFFLSGYLITTLLRLEHGRRGRVDLGAFYTRRALRILPPFLLTIALVVGLSAAHLIPDRVTPESVPFELVFLSNYSELLGTPPTLPIPLWSLDVEEHFYLLFPALFALVATWRGGRTARLLGAICLGVLAVRLATFHALGESRIYYWSHTRIDSILFGAILAVWQNPMLDRDAWRPRPAHVAAALAVMAGTIAFRSPMFRETVRYSLQGVALFVLFSAVIQARPGGAVARALDAGWLRWVALLSYTLYLVHLPLLGATEGLGRAAVPVAYLLAFGWAGGMYALVERPLARWRARSLKKAVAA